MFDIRRRDFITFFGGAAAWPLAARAQQPAKRYRIGMLETVSPALNAAQLDAFRSGLRELGYVEGQTYAMEYRSADGYANRFPELAAELVRLGVDLIVVRGTPAAIAAKNATGTIPIVMASVGEPLLVVDSLARPGRNVTGLSAFVNVMTSKRLELIRELVPTISRIALFANMSNAVAPPQWEETKTAARSMGIEAELLDVRSVDDMGRAFETAVARHVDALLVSFDGLFQANTRMIVELVARNRLPAIYVGREFIEAGGLMTYGVSFPHLYFRAATYVDKIFRGVKPADLPVEQPTKFELIINLKTAKALGLDVPWFLQQRADEVIE
jgi:putative tryptophan/tyrosine transport system substrate-binding protein